MIYPFINVYKRLETDMFHNVPKFEDFLKSKML